MTFHEPFFEAPLSNVLIVTGVLVLLAAVLGGLPGMHRMDEKGRKAAWVVGPSLIVVGLVVVPAILPTPGPSPPATATPTDALDVATATATATREGSTDPTDEPGPVTEADPVTEDRPTQRPDDPGASVVRESEPNDAAVDATLLEAGATGEGSVAPPLGAYQTVDTDQFAFWATAGESVTVEVTRRGGVGTLYAVLYDPNGHSEPSQVLVDDLTAVESGGTMRVETTARQTGYYYVMVTGAFYFIDIDWYLYDGGHGDYTVQVETGS